MQDEAVLQEQLQKKIQEEAALKQQIATLKEQMQKKDQENANLKALIDERAAHDAEDVSSVPSSVLRRTSNRRN